MTGDTNTCPGHETPGTCTDVFVRDRLNGTTERVSLDGSEGQGDSFSVLPAISDDGRFVAFHSGATNLVADDSNSLIDIFVRDRQGGTTERVSIDSAGTEASGGNSLRPAISADGRFVAFDSDATNLVADDTNALTDVFVHQLLPDATPTPTPCPDGDTDTVCDALDNCPVNANGSQEDFDLDGLGDACDDEADGDGFTNASEASIGTGALDPCGSDGWPADLQANNKLDIGDLNSFLFPLRDLNGNTIPGEPGPPPGGDDDGSGVFNKFNHPVPDTNDAGIARWNLQVNAEIDIGDLNALNPAVTSPTSRPPMFGGEPAFFADVGNGVGGCPFPP